MHPILVGAFAALLSLAVPLAVMLWIDRNEKPWVDTLIRDMKPKHPDDAEKES